VPKISDVHAESAADYVNGLFDKMPLSEDEDSFAGMADPVPTGEINSQRD
jgi:hypothetical protein